MDHNKLLESVFKLQKTKSYNLFETAKNVQEQIIHTPGTAAHLKSLENHDVSEKHLDDSLNHKDVRIRMAAANHPKATSEHIHKALSDPNPHVRASAVDNENSTKEHIERGMNDSDSNVRFSAILHKNATKAHITKALNDTDKNVRLNAIEHNKVTPEHIKTALNDSDEEVRTAAKKTSEHFMRRMGLKEDFDKFHTGLLTKEQVKKIEENFSSEDEIVSETIPVKENISESQEDDLFSENEMEHIKNVLNVFEQDDAPHSGRDPKQHIQIQAGRAAATGPVKFKHDNGEETVITPAMGRKILHHLSKLKAIGKHDAITKMHKSPSGLNI